jgi:uncharacterized membrane protein YuzA (DUF378 family)
MAKKNKVVRTINWAATILTVAGALTWGTIAVPQLFGFAGFNVVSMIFKSPMCSNVVYSLVGISSLWFAFSGLFMKALK